jgi:hypothetical protein
MERDIREARDGDDAKRGEDREESLPEGLVSDRQAEGDELLTKSTGRCSAKERVLFAYGMAAACSLPTSADSFGNPSDDLAGNLEGW